MSPTEEGENMFLISLPFPSNLPLTHTGRPIATDKLIEVSHFYFPISTQIWGILCLVILCSLSKPISLHVLDSSSFLVSYLFF